MRARYLSICGKYGCLPLLASVLILAGIAGAAGFFYLFNFFCLGLCGAGLGESRITAILRRRRMGIRRGSRALQIAQLACVVGGYCLGAAAEYGLSGQAQHDFHVLNGGTRRAFAQIVEARG